MINPKNWDEYEIKARYVPCIITVIPLSHFLSLLLGKVFWSTFASDSNWLLVVSDVSLALVAVLALMQIQCQIGKQGIEEGIFGQGGKFFPTADMLLLSGGLISADSKNRIRLKAAQLFGISFLDKEQEESDAEEARSVVREAVGQIRRCVRKGIMTHQYNIRYGFMRNLIGGLIWAVGGSFGCATFYAISKQWHAVSFFLALALTGILLFIFRKIVLQKLAFTYADSLMTEFMMEQK